MAVVSMKQLLEAGVPMSDLLAHLKQGGNGHA